MKKYMKYYSAFVVLLLMNVPSSFAAEEISEIDKEEVKEKIKNYKPISKVPSTENPLLQFQYSIVSWAYIPPIFYVVLSAFSYARWIDSSKYKLVLITWFVLNAIGLTLFVFTFINIKTLIDKKPLEYFVANDELFKSLQIRMNDAGKIEDAEKKMRIQANIDTELSRAYWSRNNFSKAIYYGEKALRIVLRLQKKNKQSGLTDEKVAELGLCRWLFHITKHEESEARRTALYKKKKKELALHVNQEKKTSKWPLFWNYSLLIYITTTLCNMHGAVLVVLEYLEVPGFLPLQHIDNMKKRGERLALFLIGILAAIIFMDLLFFNYSPPLIAVNLMPSANEKKWSESEVFVKTISLSDDGYPLLFRTMKMAQILFLNDQEEEGMMALISLKQSLLFPSKSIRFTEEDNAYAADLLYFMAQYYAKKEEWEQALHHINNAFDLQK